MSEQFKTLFELVEKINSHPALERILTIEKEEDDDLNWLPMNNIMNGHVEAPEDFKVLMEQLATELDQKFITPKGQHSQAFYDIRKHGWISRTGESDSFGPLSSILSPPGRKWFVCYG